MLVSVGSNKSPGSGNSLQALADPTFRHAIPPHIRYFVNTKERQ